LENFEAKYDLIEGLIIALNMGTGGGQTNIGDDTSENAGSPNDF
jgi:hypothetical protein